MTRSTTARSLKTTLAIGVLTMLTLTTRGDAAATPIIVVNPTPTDCYDRAGCLDTSFGSAGKVLQDVGGSQNYTSRLQASSSSVAQPDGKMLVAGSTTYPTTGRAWVVARFASTGALDPTFGTGGIVTFTNFTAKSDIEDIYAMALQPDGRILVAGWTGKNVSGVFTTGIARLTSSGTLDTSFGSNGLVLFNFDGRIIYDIKVQSDGKILLVANGGSPQTCSVGRLKSNGSLDTTFGFGGFRTITFGLPLAKVESMALQSNGKIVLAGGDGYDFALARLTTSGAYDSSFGFLGRATLDVSGKEDTIYAIAVAPDDSIVAAGRAWTSSIKSDMAFARFNANGSVKTSFGSSGKVLLDMHGWYDQVMGVAIQADGKIAFAGNAFVGEIGQGGSAFSIVGRLTANGALDSPFGTGGVTETAYIASPTSETGDFNRGQATAIALDATGKIVVSGQASGGPNGLMTWALSRYYQ